MKIRWIDAGIVPYLKSQSIYHALGYAQRKDTKNTIVLATPASPYLCLGHFQDLEKELDIAWCRTHNLPIVRRETGGGTVYIDSGQLFVQWIFQREDLPRSVDQRFRLFLEPMVETYKFFGIDAKIYPPNDVHVNGKKIVGTGAATIGDAEVITGNFLFDFHTEPFIRALAVPDESFREQVKQSLDHYLTSFRQELGIAPAPGEVAKVYQQQCKRLLGATLESGSFSDLELETMHHQEQHLTDETWLRSISSQPATERLLKIHAGLWLGHMIHHTREGTITITSRLRDGKIDFVRIKTGSGQWTKLEEQLIGTPIQPEPVSRIIESYFSQAELGDKFSKTDWMDAIMKVQKEKERISGYA